MLLRLLPVPSPSQPSPPTILFTLPLPNLPYTAKSLPLPPNLLTHRALCIQEDIDISNALLGEKSSWIGGVIDEVTFSLPQSAVAVQLIDGTSHTFELSDACIGQLHRVVDEVQLSFAAAAAPPPAPPRASVSSIASNASSSSSSSSSSAPSSSAVRRSPSALLFSLLSPLLAQPAPASAPAHVAAQQQPARMHRRQARSLLVDAYRRHVLPIVRDQLPAAYLPWAIESETSRRLAEFEHLKSEIEALLASAGVDISAYDPPAKRARDACSNYDSSAHSDSDDADSPYTCATSLFSSAASSKRRSGSITAPHAFMLTIPPAHAVPLKQRSSYSNQLQRLTALSSRLQAIRRLGTRYDREEGKRRWLDSLELGRLADKATRRAVSAGQLRPPAHASDMSATPSKRSRLSQSWSAADQARAEAAAAHPCMGDYPGTMSRCMSMETVDEVCSADEDDASSISSSPSSMPYTPTSERMAPVYMVDDDDMEQDENVSPTRIRVVHADMPARDRLGLVLDSSDAADGKPRDPLALLPAPSMLWDKAAEAARPPILDASVY